MLIAIFGIGERRICKLNNYIPFFVTPNFKNDSNCYNKILIKEESPVLGMKKIKRHIFAYSVKTFEIHNYCSKQMFLTLSVSSQRCLFQTSEEKFSIF